MIGCWYGVYYLLLSPRRRLIFPTPDQIFTEAVWNSQIAEEIWEAFRATAYLSFVGLLVSILAGVSLAVAMNYSKLAEKGFLPWAVGLQAMPIFALIPVINLWFDNVETPFLWYDANFKKRLIVCVLIALFPIIINTHFGLKSTDKNLRSLFQLHKASPVTRLFRLEFRAATPAIFVGFKIAAGLSVIGAIVAEFLFRRGGTGLGNLIDLYRGTANYEALYATLIASSLFGILIYSGFTWLSNVLTRHWHASAQDFSY